MKTSFALLLSALFALTSAQVMELIVATFIGFSNISVVSSMTLAVTYKVSALELLRSIKKN